MLAQRLGQQRRLSDLVARREALGDGGVVGNGRLARGDYHPA